MTKQEIRLAMKQLLRTKSPSVLERAAKDCLRLLQSQLNPTWENVLLYHPLSGEVPSQVFHHWFLNLGKAIFYPRSWGLEMAYLKASPDEFVRDAKGFLAPPEYSPQWMGGEALLLAPALAADAQGHRLGRGGGYFDRFLATHLNIFSIIVILDEQLVPILPVDPWDATFKAVLTPTQFIFLD